MGLEASDLSDGAILESTQQFQNGNGQVQFKITLPSGRELESEWLSPDMKKKAMVQWLDVVKDQAILDADQARAEAREAAMKQRRDAAQAQEPTPENVSTDTQPPSSTGQSLSAPTAGPAAVAASQRQPITSPDDFVAAGLKAAEADYDHWNQVALDAASRLVAAQQNISKWTNIKRSLEGHAQSSTSNHPDTARNDSTDTSGSPAPRRRKRAVAKSTDVKVYDFSGALGGSGSV